tara:strand:+ start:216 stop:437 length:222 start_codon:yes stop_codon:yes gene_type:complete
MNNTMLSKDYFELNEPPDPNEKYLMQLEQNIDEMEKAVKKMREDIDTMNLIVFSLLEITKEETSHGEQHHQSK